MSPKPPRGPEQFSTQEQGTETLSPSTPQDLSAETGPDNSEGSAREGELSDRSNRANQDQATQLGSQSATTLEPSTENEVIPFTEEDEGSIHDRPGVGASEPKEAFPALPGQIVSESSGVGERGFSSEAAKGVGGLALKPLNSDEPLTLVNKLGPSGETETGAEDPEDDQELSIRKGAGHTEHTKSPLALPSVPEPPSPKNADSRTRSQYSARSNHSNLGKELKYRRRQKKAEAEESRGWPDPDKYNPVSLYLFGLNHPVRRACIGAIEWKWWDRIVLAMIFLNTIQLAMFNPFDTAELRPDATQRDVMDYIGKVFSVIFALECVAKVVAMGLMIGRHTYLSVAWNYLDFFVVILGLLDFMPSGGGGSDLSALRALRVLRPLRAVVRFPELRFLVILLLQCVPMLSNVVGLCTFIFFVFGILGVQTFQGVFRGRCYDINDGLIRDEFCTLVGGMSKCPENFECLLLGENWGRDSIHFDHIGGAMLAIFQVMTLEGWTDLMYACQDTYSIVSLVYFVILIFIGPMFAVQLFLVVISNKFGETKKDLERIDANQAIAMEQKKQEDLNFALQKQQSLRKDGNDSPNAWANSPTMATMPHASDGTPKHTKSFLRRAHWKIRLFAKSDFLMYGVLAIIGLNTASMALDHNCDPCDGGFCKNFKKILELSNLGFTGVFVLELLIKVIGLGVRKYVESALNLFDAVIVAVSIYEIPTVLETGFCYSENKTCFDYYHCEGGTGVSVLRTFRLVRIVKLMRAFPDIQKQVLVLAQVMGSVASLCVLIFILLFIFLVLGMNLFGGKLKSEWNNPEIALGAWVYIDFPWDPAVTRHGRIIDVDFRNHTAAPWNVEVTWGKEGAVQASLGLSPEGTIWACSLDDVCAGLPIIVARSPRFNFDTFVHAAMTTFQILTVEGWNEDLYDVLASLGPASGLYFYALIVLGNWMLLNLFIAILIQQFGEQKAMQLEDDMRKMQEKLLERLGGLEEGDLAKQIGDLYDSIDADGSGEIDKYEFKAALEGLGVKLGAKDLQDLVSKYDVDGNGSIDFEEFLAMIKELLSEAWEAIALEREAKEEEAKNNPPATPDKSRPNSPPRSTRGSSPDASRPGSPDKGEKPRSRSSSARLAKKNSTSSAPQHSGSQSPGPGNLLGKSTAKSFDSRTPSSKDGEMQTLSKTPSSPPGTPGTPGTRGQRGRSPSRATDKAAHLGTSGTPGNPGAPNPPGAPGSPAPPATSEPPSPLAPPATPGLERTASGSGAKADRASSSESRPKDLALTKKQFASMRNLQDDTLALEAKAHREKNPVTRKVLPVVVDESRSCFVLTSESSIRRFCKFVAENWWFDQFILLCIFISSVALAIDRPRIGENSPERTFLTNLDLFLNAAFLMECVLKVTAQSFVIYIKSGWNKLDFMIVSTSVIDMGMTYGLSGQNVSLEILKVFRVFRILRALRPLRIIARARGLRILVGTLLSSLKPVANTSGIALAVYSVLGILGMQLLSGKMFSCTDPKIWNKELCFGNDEEGVHREWKRYDVNFDDIYNAVRSMFILSTMDDWPAHMWVGVDATTKITGPKQDNNPSMFLFYICSLLLSGYLVVNIFVGVFVDCYRAAASEMEVEKKEKITQLPEIFVDPETGLRVHIFAVLTSGAFDIFIAFFIIANVVTMAFESWKPSSWQVRFDSVANFFFTFVFGWECIFKIWALRPRRYLANGWNKFDYFIVMVSFLGILADNVSSAFPIEPTVLRILRVFRIFRILRAFRIFKALRGLQAIIATLFNSLPAIINLFSMLGLLFFIFGILGVTMFGSICIDGDQSQPGMKAALCMFTDEDMLFARQANFRNLGFSLLTLFRVTTGDDWGAVLEISQLLAGKRFINDDIWNDVKQLLGEDPSTLNPNHINYMTKDQEDAPRKVAALAIRQWNATVFGMDKDPDWPFPLSKPLARKWMLIGRRALPVCLPQEDAVHLQDLGLVDCDVGGYSLKCESTCGDWIIANLYYMIFFAIASFVLLQLVIAVLMEQLSIADDDTNVANLVPGCTALNKAVLARIQRRWRCQAKRKMLHLSLKSSAASRTTSRARTTGSKETVDPSLVARTLSNDEVMNERGRG